MFVFAVISVPVLICLAASLLVTRQIIRRYSVEQQPVRPLRFSVECLLAISIIVATMMASGVIVGTAVLYAFSQRNTLIQ